MDPKKVISPKKKIKSDIEVVIQEKDFTIATFIFGETRRIGIRWNGANDDEKGYPLSCGYPTWFILPKPVALAYATQIENVVAKEVFLKIED